MPQNSAHSEANHAQQPQEFLVVGRVLRPHGIRGALVVEGFSDFIHSLRAGSEIHLGPDNVPLKIVSIRKHKNKYLLTHNASVDRTEAEAYRDFEVKLRFQDTEPLGEGEYFYWQIIGLEVLSEACEHLGVVAEIRETGANDVYIVRDDEGRELLLPAIKSVILEVDLDAGQITVHLLPGLVPGVE
jgi:16S rRNA processing protein RimM